MTRLIDADALKRIYRGNGTFTEAHFRTAIDEQPTVDDVPVLRREDGRRKAGRMSNDLVSRQAAIDVLDAYQVMVENGEENPYAWARARMCELPSAQPEIVRCGECKYSHPYMLGLYRCDRTDIALATGKDEYCSRGVRKDDVSD